MARDLPRQICYDLWRTASAMPSTVPRSIRATILLMGPVLGLGTRFLKIVDLHGRFLLHTSVQAGVGPMM